jgi:threonine aldolase
MRQAGILAAAALYALDNNFERLADDHKNAQVIAQAIGNTPGLNLLPAEVHTNLIWFDVDPAMANAKQVAAALKAQKVLVYAAGPYTLRACTHLDVTTAQAEQAADTIRRTVPRLQPLEV